MAGDPRLTVGGVTDASSPTGDLFAELATARLAGGVTYDELASATRLRPSVVERLIDGDVTAVGGWVYARGHLRVIATHLGLDADALLASPA